MATAVRNDSKQDSDVNGCFEIVRSLYDLTSSWIPGQTVEEMVYIQTVTANMNVHLKPTTD